MLVVTSEKLRPGSTCHLYIDPDNNIYINAWFYRYYENSSADTKNCMHTGLYYKLNESRTAFILINEYTSHNPTLYQLSYSGTADGNDPNYTSGIFDLNGKIYSFKLNIVTAPSNQQRFHAISMQSLNPKTEYKKNDYTIALTNNTGSIATQFWSAISALTVSDTSLANINFAHYAYALEDLTAVQFTKYWYIFLAEQTDSRPILRYDSTNNKYQLNSGILYSSNVWIDATTALTDEKMSLKDAINYSAINRCSKSDLSTITRSNIPFTTVPDPQITKFSFALILLTSTDTTPTADNLVINYSGAIKYRASTHNYTIDILDDSTIQLTAPQDQTPVNVKVYVIG